MSENDKVLEFIIFCIENAAARLKRNGADVYAKMKEAGAVQYIRRYYDTLHTQGTDYIVDALLEYIYYRDPHWLPREYTPHNATVVEGGAGC